MHRFYCPDLKTNASHAELLDSPSWSEIPPLPLPEAESRHALKVLRLREGDEIEVFNGRGLTAQGRLHVASSKQAHVTLVATTSVPSPQPRVAIAAAMPKGPRVDWMVEQLSQLGVDLLVPLNTRYSVVEPRQAKLDRLRHAAIESAKQCRRAWIMHVSDPRTFSELVADPLWGDSTPATAAPLRLIADAGGQLLAPETMAHVAAIQMLIGPEGGWDNSEKQLALAHGFKLWRLGPNVLRIETAAAAAAAILRAAAPA